MTDTMRQVVLAAPGQVSITDAPIPSPTTGELLVRSRVVGVCGSDLHALAGEHPFIDLPVVPGHEAVGVVAAAEETGNGPHVGDRVLVEPNLVCGRCRYCSAGRYNLCEHLRVLGCQTPGAMAEWFTVPADRVRVLPPDLSDAQAAVVEPTATAVHAVRLAGDLAGRTVAVLGGGTVGLLTLRAALAAGAGRCVVTDPQAAKQQRATDLGAELSLSPTDADLVSRVRDFVGGPVEVTFDCVANQSSIQQAVSLARKGGTVVVVGVPTEPVRVDLPVLQDEEIRIQGSAMYVSADVTEAVHLVQSGHVAADDFVTATYPLEQAQQAFAAAQSGAHLKVHVTVGNDR